MGLLQLYFLRCFFFLWDVRQTFYHAVLVLISSSPSSLSEGPPVPTPFWIPHITFLPPRFSNGSKVSFLGGQSLLINPAKGVMMGFYPLYCSQQIQGFQACSLVISFWIKSIYNFSPILQATGSGSVLWIKAKVNVF